jgi:hypothetical protein
MLGLMGCYERCVVMKEKTEKKKDFIYAALRADETNVVSSCSMVVESYAGIPRKNSCGRVHPCNKT